MSGNDVRVLPMPLMAVPGFRPTASSAGEYQIPGVASNDDIFAGFLVGLVRSSQISSTGGLLFSKGASNSINGFAKQIYQQRVNGFQLSIDRNGAGTQLTCRGVTYNPSYTAVEWWWTMCAWDTTLTSADQKMYGGPLIGSRRGQIAEATSYPVRNVGSNTPISNAGDPIRIGNSFAGGTNAFNGQIAYLAIFRGYPKGPHGVAQEVVETAWRRGLREAHWAVDGAQCVGAWIPGLIDRSRVLDLSGFGNHGTVQSSANVKTGYAEMAPIPLSVRTRSYFVPAAGGGSTIATKVFDYRRRRVV